MCAYGYVCDGVINGRIKGRFNRGGKSLNFKIAQNDNRSLKRL